MFTSRYTVHRLHRNLLPLTDLQISPSFTMENFCIPWKCLDPSSNQPD
ncbi:hypothetical protein A2U01_0098282, partial [Trifolium medium]|nr:hypothetical protein [Trifolium medium]